MTAAGLVALNPDLEAAAAVPPGMGAGYEKNPGVTL
jgi:hypothetical protein